MSRPLREQRFSILTLTSVAEEVARRLLPTLTQDALNFILEMPRCEYTTYSELMENALENLSHSLEVHRRQYTCTRIQANETLTQFSLRIKSKVTSWLTPTGTPQEDRIVSFVARDLFVDGLPARLSRHVRAHNCPDLQGSTILAEECRLRRGPYRLIRRPRPIQTISAASSSIPEAAEEAEAAEVEAEAAEVEAEAAEAQEEAMAVEEANPPPALRRRNSM